MHRLVISSNRQNITNVYQWLQDNLLDRASPTLLLVVQEAVSNSIIHGNNEDESKNVTIEYKIENEKIRFFLTDEGEGDIVLPANIGGFEDTEEQLLTEGGRGLKLINFYAQELKVYKRTMEILIGLNDV